MPNAGPAPPSTTPDVALVGGGLVGLALAAALAERGRSVAVFDAGRAGRGASWHAAGMLAPAAELGFEELDLYALGQQSLARWPAFARSIKAVTGRDVGYRSAGTLLVADDRDAAAALRRQVAFRQRHGAALRWLDPDEALEREPFLSPRLAAVALAPEDHQVDNRAAVEALRERALKVGRVTLYENEPVIAIEEGAVVTLQGRTPARAVVVTAGVGAGSLKLPAGCVPTRVPVRPVKGQALALRPSEPFALTHTVRGPDAYLVPKADRLVVGATSEDVGLDARVTAGGVFGLLEGARNVVPGVDELELVETWAGFRPASRDHAPLLGSAGPPGLFLATGHYRHGVLLAPVTAWALAEEVDAYLKGGSPSAEVERTLAPFRPSRFRSRAPSEPAGVLAVPPSPLSPPP